MGKRHNTSRSHQKKKNEKKINNLKLNGGLAPVKVMFDLDKMNKIITVANNGMNFLAGLGSEFEKLAGKKTSAVDATGNVTDPSKADPMKPMTGPSMGPTPVPPPAPVPVTYIAPPQPQPQPVSATPASAPAPISVTHRYIKKLKSKNRRTTLKKMPFVKMKGRRMISPIGGTIMTKPQTKTQKKKR